jgi:hypothetical protein
MKNLFDSNSDFKQQWSKIVIKTIATTFEQLQSYFLFILLQFVTNYEGIIAVIYTIIVTIGIKAGVMLGSFFCIDQIETFLRKNFGIPPRSIYSMTWVDRGFAFLAAVWAMGELFTFNPMVVMDFQFLQDIDRNFLRGIGFFINLHPLNSTIVSFIIFREVVRRRGPDTQWFGDTKKFWIKNVVRYHWCFAFCINTVVQIYMYCTYKFLIPQGMSAEQQEIAAVSFFFLIAGVITYSGVCALFGLRSKLPLFHGACTSHVGKLKDSSND